VIEGAAGGTKDAFEYVDDDCGVATVVEQAKTARSTSLVVKFISPTILITLISYASFHAMKDVGFVERAS